MRFVPLPLEGAFVIEPVPVTDERGFFARTFCQEEFAARGLTANLAQCSVSYNNKKGTLRGLHFQKKPHEEAKLVRCTRGAIFDVIVDLRRDSGTYCRWHAVNLTDQNRRAIYVPEGFAHGFQSLEDACEVFYQISEFYEPGSSCGVRWNDPAFGIEWPISSPILSLRDKSYENYRT